jgi:hypothetical protein
MRMRIRLEGRFEHQFITIPQVGKSGGGPTSACPDDRRIRIAATAVGQLAIQQAAWVYYSYRVRVPQSVLEGNPHPLNFYPDKIPTEPIRSLSR